MFPDFDIALMKAGEQSGRLDTVLEQTAARSRSAAAARMEEAVSVAEPTLVIILSVVVGLVLLSMLLPLMGVLSAM
ncbi:MAG: type II secretion system F family protein [Lachnospiraceae bacterium]|nr:type II secretion system F family protein [Lachnospiraceae bacterium]